MKRKSKASVKIAMTTLVEVMELQGWPEPKVGEYSIIPDASGKPRAIIRTSSVRRVRFCEVDEEHAYSEGEGDMTLESYLRGQIKYYGGRSCGN